ncbi:MAG: hypothetical protein U0787_10380 [Polyangia bacterium]
MGLQGEVDFRIGYLHSFAADESFGVVNGRVISLGRVSYPTLIFGPQLGVGWFIARWGVTPFARVGALFSTPPSTRPSSDSTLQPVWSAYDSVICLLALLCTVGCAADWKDGDEHFFVTHKGVSMRSGSPATGVQTTSSFTSTAAAAPT